jgi:hypothetical protein
MNIDASIYSSFPKKTSFNDTDVVTLVFDFQIRYVITEKRTRSHG